MSLGKQLHLSNEKVLAKHVISVKNGENVYLKKPLHGTGLWTSAWREETRDSGWVDYCRWGSYGSPEEQYWFLLTPAQDARLYTISEQFDLKLLLSRYPCYSRYDDNVGIDFERLAQHYDGLRVTEEAVWSLRFIYPNNIDWSCESTVWFRFVFTAVERIEVQKPVEVGE
jgi:hypothetical protein